MIRNSQRNYSSVLRYADRVRSGIHAELVTELDNHDVTPLDQIDDRSSRERRLHPHTLQGKTSGNQMLIMPPELCNVVSQTTLKHKPQDLRKVAARYYLNLQESNAHQPTKHEIDADTHLNAVFLQSYGSITSVLSEAKRRLGSEWKPKRILDVGYGPSTGMLALNQLMKDETWEPTRKDSVIIGNPNMKKRAKEMLKAQTDETTRITQTLPGYNTLKYDLIIATHQLYRSDFHFPASTDDHSSHLLSLLAPDGILILIERGDPKGFESIARARQIMFRPEDHPGDNSKVPRDWKTVVENDSVYKLKIVAPCSHHGVCPLQVGLDLRRKASNQGFFNWCKFGQMIQRPKFTQELKKGQYLAAQWDEETPGKGPGGQHLSGSGRPFGLSYETATHSYLIIQRQTSDEQVLTPHDSWPRILRSPMKRDKHVVMEVCAPSAQVEQWIVTKSFDRQSYHDARKATGGDLWALNAKTKTERGGNRAALAKSEKIEAKNLVKSTLTKPSIGNDEKSNEIVNAAWSGREMEIPRGHEPHPDFDVELNDYFEQLGQEFQHSHEHKKQIKKEKRAAYHENKSSRW